MIPQEKSAAVCRGLREAFGVSEFEAIRRITKGHTPALVFRIEVRGTPFLLRIITSENLVIGPERQYGCMKAAAEVGVAPRVWYSSVEDRICITDFVEEAPFPVTEALVRMPAVLRRLHALPPFPRVVDHLNTSCMFLMNKGPALDGFTRRVREAKILPESEIAQLFAWHAQVADIYPHDNADMVSSHNDLFKPDNILFDGERVWLVDWEAACLNDRYADPAVVANMIVSNEEEEAIYLREYFGQPADEYQLARFYLARQIAHMFYAMAFLWIGSPGGPAAPLDFQRRFWAGEFDLVDGAMKTMYGRVHWEQLVENVRQRRFQEALRIVSERGVSINRRGTEME